MIHSMANIREVKTMLKAVKDKLGITTTPDVTKQPINQGYQKDSFKSDFFKTTLSEYTTYGTCRIGNKATPGVPVDNSPVEVVSYIPGKG
jgi:hypothetical protein